MSKYIRKILLLIILIIVSIMPILSFAQQYEDIYTIYGINVSSSQNSSSNARADALQKGEIEAFNKLVENFQLSNIQQAPENISKMILSYEIVKEKIKDKSYSAEINYIFNPNIIRTLIQENQPALTKISNDQMNNILVIPTYYSNNESNFTNNNKLWYQLWRDKTRNKLVNFSLVDSKIRGIASFQDIDQRNIDTLIKISENLDAPILLLTEIIEDTDYTFLNNLYFDRKKNFYFETNTSFEGKITNNNLEKILDNAVKFSESMSLKANNNLKSINVEFSLYKTKELVLLKQFLEGKSFIKHYNVNILSYPKASFYIQHTTSNDWLLHELANSGFRGKLINLENNQ